jgi:hypothetical protein
MVWEHHVLPTMREAAQRPEAVPSAQLVAATAFPLLAGLLGPAGSGAGAASSRQQQQQPSWKQPAGAGGLVPGGASVLQQLQQLAVVVTTDGALLLGSAAAARDASSTQGSRPPDAAADSTPVSTPPEAAGTTPSNGSACAAASETPAASRPPVVYLPASLGNSVDLPAAFPAKQWTMVSGAYAAVRGVSREAWAWLFGQLGVHTSLPILRRTLHVKGRQDWLASPWAEGLPAAVVPPAPAAAEAAPVPAENSPEAWEATAGGDGSTVSAIGAAAGPLAEQPASPPAAAAAPAPGPALPSRQRRELRQRLAPLLASASTTTTVVTVEDHHCPELEELLTALLAGGGSGSRSQGSRRQQLLALLALLDSCWQQQEYRRAASASASASSGAGGVQDVPLPSSFLLALWRLPWLPDSVGGLSQPGRLFVKEQHVSVLLAACCMLPSGMQCGLCQWLKEMKHCGHMECVRHSSSVRAQHPAQPVQPNVITHQHSASQPASAQCRGALN